MTKLIAAAMRQKIQPAGSVLVIIVNYSKMVMENSWNFVKEISWQPWNTSMHIFPILCLATKLWTVEESFKNFDEGVIP